MNNYWKVKKLSENNTFGRKIEHPSFGMISIVRGTCSESMNLFGSSIKQRSFVQIDIHRAKLFRGLNQDNVFQDGIPLISIMLSPSQFADMITSLNSGGTPCTISFVEGHKVSEPLLESKRVQFDTEFEEHMEKIASDTNEYYVKIKEILSKPNIGKHDKEEVLKQIGFIKQEIASNIPFIKKEFSEQMDMTVVEAKKEFDSFVEDKIRRIGIEKSKNNLVLEHKELVKEK